MPSQYREPWLTSQGYTGLTDEQVDWCEEQKRLRAEEVRTWTPYYYRKLFGLTMPAEAIKGGLDRDTVMEKADPIRVVEMYIQPPYKVMGSRMTVRCPFHQDTRPSMAVYIPQKRWWCFVCNEGGSLIDLIMKAEGLGFKDALRKLDSIV